MNLFSEHTLVNPSTTCTWPYKTHTHTPIKITLEMGVGFVETYSCNHINSEYFVSFFVPPPKKEIQQL